MGPGTVRSLDGERERVDEGSKLKNVGPASTPELKSPENPSFSGVVGHLAKANEVVMIALTVVMVSLVTYQVFERYVLHYTPPWSEELAVDLMIWFGMLAIAAGVRRRMHISLHYFADKMPKKVQSALEIFKYVLILGYVSVLLWQGIGLVQLTMPQKSAAMDLPVGYVYLALPVSATLILIFTFEELYTLFFKKAGAK